VDTNGGSVSVRRAIRDEPTYVHATIINRVYYTRHLRKLTGALIFYRAADG